MYLGNNKQAPFFRRKETVQAENIDLTLPFAMNASFSIVYRCPPPPYFLVTFYWPCRRRSSLRVHPLADMDGGPWLDSFNLTRFSCYSPPQLQRARDRASVEEARRIWIQGLEGDRAADAATAAAAAASGSSSAPTSEQASSVAALSGRGILSFLDPPTSDAEAFAAAALSERYRLLGEEADARAARARWKRQRSERAIAARASLNMLYAKEANAWKVMVAEAAGGGGETAENRSVDVELSAAAVGDGVGNGGYDKGAEYGDTEGGMATEGEAEEDAVAQGGLTGSESAPSPPLPPPPPAAQSLTFRRSKEDISLGEIDAAIADGTGQDERPSRHGGEAMTKEQVASTTVERDSRQGDGHRDDTKFSHVTIVQEPGGKSTGVSAALGAGETLLDGTTPPDDPPLKFSQVKIVQEPGGKSDGVSRALGADTERGGDTRAPSAHDRDVGTKQELRDKAGGVSRVSSSASLHHVAGVVDGAVERLGDAVLGETDGRDNLESRSRETHASDIDFASLLHAVETTGEEEDGVGSHSGDSYQDEQSSRLSSVDVAEPTSEARVEPEGSGDAGEPRAAVGRTIGFALRTTKVRKRSFPLLGDGL